MIGLLLKPAKFEKGNRCRKFSQTAEARRLTRKSRARGYVGLTAATALRQRGWTVRVHEKSHELRQFGAGIFLWENGLRVLEHTGAAADVFAHSVQPPIYETRFQHATVSKETFGPIRWRTMTRQNLYGAVLEAAKRARGGDRRRLRGCLGRPRKVRSSSPPAKC